MGTTPQTPAHEINFEVIKSLDDFFYSTKFISLAVGPVGSTKTTAGVMKILHSYNFV